MHVIQTLTSHYMHAHAGAECVCVCVGVQMLFQKCLWNPRTSSVWTSAVTL